MMKLKPSLEKAYVKRFKADIQIQEAKAIRKSIFREMMADYRPWCAERNFNWPEQLEEAVRSEFPDEYSDRLTLQQNLKAMGLESLL